MGIRTRVKSALGMEHRGNFYSPAVEDALFNAALVGRSDASQTAAAATAIRVIADSFAVAVVSPSSLSSILNPPPLLVDLVRRLLLTGNVAYLVDSDESGGLDLIPAQTFEVSGGYRPSSWVYKLELARPSGSPIVRLVPAEGVVHVKINASRSSPWMGSSALGNLSASALAALGRSLTMDMSPPSGYLLPTPDGASQEVIDQAAQALRNGQGGISLIQTMAAGFGQGAPAAPKKDWSQVRFGPMIPPESLSAHDTLSVSLLNALGVSEQLYHGGGPAQRESARQLYLGVINPLAAIITHELSRVLNEDVRLNFAELRALDTALRSKAAAALVAAGMSLSDAIDLLGLED